VEKIYEGYLGGYGPPGSRFWALSVMVERGKKFYVTVKAEAGSNQGYRQVDSEVGPFKSSGHDIESAMERAIEIVKKIDNYDPEWIPGLRGIVADLEYEQELADEDDAIAMEDAIDQSIK